MTEVEIGLSACYFYLRKKKRFCFHFNGRLILVTRAYRKVFKKKVKYLLMNKFLTKTILASMNAIKLNVTAFQDSTLATITPNGRTIPSKATFKPRRALMRKPISPFLYFRLFFFPRPIIIIKIERLMIKIKHLTNKLLVGIKCFSRRFGLSSRIAKSGGL